MKSIVECDDDDDDDDDNDDVCEMEDEKFCLPFGVVGSAWNWFLSRNKMCAVKHEETKRTMASNNNMLT